MLKKLYLIIVMIIVNANSFAAEMAPLELETVETVDYYNRWSFPSISKAKNVKLFDNAETTTYAADLEEGGSIYCTYYKKRDSVFCHTASKSGRIRNFENTPFLKDVFRKLRELHAEQKS